MKKLEKLVMSGALRAPILLLLMVTGAGLSQAAISSCTSATAITFPGSNTDGCASVDLDFVNFNKTGTMTGLTYQATAGTINTAPNPDTITTTTLNIAGPSTTSGIFGDRTITPSPTYSISYQTNNNGTNAPTEANYVWAFSGITLAPSLTLNGGDSTTITYTFCFNATAESVGSGGCVASNQGSFTVAYTRSGTQVGGSVTTSSYGSAITGPGNGTAATAINLTTVSLQLTTSPSNLFTSMFLSTTITMTAATGQNSYLTNLAIGYNQTAASTIPEPGTLGLLGAGLLGLGLLAGRKRS